MSETLATSIFAPNPLRATRNQIVLQLLKAPIDIIKDGDASTFEHFIALVSQHSAISAAVMGVSATTNKIQETEIKYSTLDPTAIGSASDTTGGFTNRFDQKLYESFSALIKAREDAEKSREEHDKVMETRPPPTPPPEEHQEEHEDENGGEREIQYDEEGNEIEPEEGNEHHNRTQSYGDENGGTAAQPPRARKTRAQRKEEEKQKKEDKKREFEVLKKEHLVACLEQKLANALCASAVRVVVSP